MTDEEIAERRQHVNRTQTVFGMEWRQTFCYTSGEYADLLAEVERLRLLAHNEHVIGQAFVDRINELEKQNAALREIVEAVADAGPMIPPFDQYDGAIMEGFITKARTLLGLETE